VILATVSQKMLYLRRKCYMISRPSTLHRTCRAFGCVSRLSPAPGWRSNSDRTVPWRLF